MLVCILRFLFFQAEDGIRDIGVTGVQTCALPISTVVNVKRSAPRPPGAKMAVNESGEVSGAVSGGCVEGAVVEAATEVLKGGAPRLLHFGIADSEAWDVGLPCGGAIDVWVERYEPGRFTDLAAAGGRAAEVTLL